MICFPCIVDQQILPIASGLEFITKEKVEAVILQHFNVTLTNIKAKTRRIEVCYKRQIFAFFLKEFTMLSNREISKHIGFSDESGTAHAKKAIQDYLATDEKVVAEVSFIRQKILKSNKTIT